MANRISAMGILSRRDFSRSICIGLLGLMLSSCAAPDRPEPEAPPVARHPILPVQHSGSDRLENQQRATGTTGNVDPLSGPNTKSSRMPRSGARIEREMPKPAEAIETRTYPTPKVPGRGFDTAPVGTIDTRPGTIRPPYLEIPGS